MADVYRVWLLSCLGRRAVAGPWENALPARTGISQRTARAARSLLGTILGDPATAKPLTPACKGSGHSRRTCGWAGQEQCRLLRE
jgi:hypothetical protein